MMNTKIAPFLLVTIVVALYMYSLTKIFNRIDMFDSLFALNQERNSYFLERQEEILDNWKESIDRQNAGLIKLMHNLNRNQTKEISFENLNGKVSKVDVFDLKKPLEPKEAYNFIECRKSAVIRDISTDICVHDRTKDLAISVQILDSGVWEREILDDFLVSLQKCKDCLVFDLGANIGQYSLFAASLGKKVVSVEPFYDNILRIHKASKLANTSNRITLIKNALSDFQGRYMLLTKDKENIGGQTLLNYKELEFSEKDLKNREIGHHLVRTTLLDDFIDILPFDDNNTNFKKAIMKIDIEGFEPYAFKKAKKLFDRLKFMVIYMEFVVLRRKIELHSEVQHMINFLYDYGLKPYDKNNLLDRNMWKTDWPDDIVWRRE